VLFPTVTFAFFLVIVLPASWLLMPRLTVWRPFMVAASYVFYGWWDWHFVFLLVGSTLGNQLAAQAIHRERRQGRRKAILAAAVCGNLGVLAYFKYAGFFLSSATNVVDRIGLDVAPRIVSVTLPVGISFFTFMALSYVIDTYRRDFRPVSLPLFAVYLSFFPHLVAGPIVRPAELVPQLETPRDPRRVDAARAFGLIVTGLFMKVVIANFLASEIVDSVFGAPGEHSSLETLVAVYGYAVQIFADFFGYTNIAIGVALLLGFQFPQNFDSPYAALSVQDFWRRWHMTLSRWLRDYLYIPLGGSRGSRLATYRNLMLTMLLGGLWHGAAWTFVAWGGMQGLGLVLNRFLQDRRRARGLPEPRVSAFGRAWRRLLTFNFVCLAWVFFRADSFGAARDVLKQLFVAWGRPSPLVSTGVVLAIAVGIGMQYVPRRVPELVMARFSRLSPLAMGVSLAVVLVAIGAMGPQGVAPFIYFRF
jgi:alginate O-acetyltransferase complex protein AlgI